MRVSNLEDVSEHFNATLSEFDRYIISCVKPGGNYMDIPSEKASRRVKNLQETGCHTTLYGRLLPEKPSYTINTYFDRPNSGCNIHYVKRPFESNQKRNLIYFGAPGTGKSYSLNQDKEKLLKSFPDNYDIISTSKRGKNLIVGNAVPPILSEILAQSLIVQIKERGIL